MKLRLAFLVSLCAASTCSALLWIVPSRFSATSSPASATDTFNRADANPMSTTMSDGVATWTDSPGASSGCKILSNELVGTGNNSMARVLAPTFSAAHKATVTLPASGTFNYRAPAVCIQGASDASGYMLFVDSGTTVQFYKVTDTGSIALAQIGSNITGLTITNGTQIGLSISGTTLTAYVDGVSVGTATDATYSGGQPGIYLYESGRGIDAFTATDL